MSRYKSLELFKFTIYVTLPIFTTYVYMQPDIVQQIVSGLGYVKFPAQDVTRDEMIKKLKKGQQERKN
ncbi:Aste57867_13422 [Aphanomyces stellatus]|uniref:Aste57867_13422 protein n=1 Tax=Aphanomyces stellatus TaxID=120398 RepID=A0A485KYZ4_9STRA|nr:hypothetical protein As57867_013372 [Aphanomyces stellatus]VFT90261.1 Aste57867_13422 [Aphanomyces stellatus]